MAQNPELLLINKVLDGGDWTVVLKRGLDKRRFTDWQIEWRWLVDHMAKYGEPPSADAVESFEASMRRVKDEKNYEFTRHPVSDPIEYLCDQVEDWLQDHRLVEVLFRAADKAVEGKRAEIPDLLEQAKAVLSATGNTTRFIQASTVRPQKREWCWFPYIAFRELAIIEGRKGGGKSTITKDLAAKVSAGKNMPGEEENENDPMNVMILSAEEILEQDIVPCLLEAKADMERVHVFDVLSEFPELPDGIGRIRDRIIELDVRLVVIDPINTFLRSGTRTGDDMSIRKALQPLVTLAQSTGVAVVLIRHVRKSAAEGDALDAGLGSVGYAGLARSVLLVGMHPENTDTRVLAFTAGNSAKTRPPSLEFRLQDASTINYDAKVIEWLGEVKLTADDINQRSTRERGRPSDIRDAASTWLEDELACGPDLKQKIIDKGVAAGHSETTINRAARELGIQRQRKGKEVIWSLEEVAP